ncbi:hypothetical protein [Caudoviricetes sp.]|nr:hypothetical protein [Caudoviricetes sp.]
MGVETALAAASIGVTLAGSGMSFAQAAKQKRMQAEAEREAQAAFDKAEAQLDVNYYDKIALNTEAYRAQREAMLAAGAQQIQAAQEDPYGRGLAAVAGRVQMAQTQGQQEITQQQSKEMLGLQELSAKESSRLAGEKAKLYEAQAEGAQTAAQNAQAASAAYTQAGVEGIGKAIGQGIAMVPYATKNASVNAFEDLQKSYQSAADAGKLPSQFLDESGKAMPFQQALGKLDGSKYGMNFTGVGNLNPIQFQDYMTQQKADNLKSIASQFSIPEQQRTNDNTGVSYFDNWLNALGQPTDIPNQ